jgi:putative transposase
VSTSAPIQIPARYGRRVTRILRSSLPDGFFHVSARGVDRGSPVFTDDDDRCIFLGLVWRTAKHYRWRCHALCILSTHYHLVVEATRDELSSGMQRLNSSYALSFNRRHGRFGHLFAERFSARVIEDETYLYDACAYVVLNPVKAGLCDRIEDWPWSYSRYGREV